MTENRFRPQFTPDCTKPEVIFGMIYLLFHMFAMPLLIPVLQQHVFPELDEITANAVYYGIGIVVSFTVFYRMLRREFDHFMDRPFHCLRGFFTAYFLWYAFSFLLVSLTQLFGQNPTPPNDQAVDLLAKQNFNLTLVIAVIVAPIVEEILFRGVLFQSILQKSRLMAYLISLLMFGLYHVWQFALAYHDISYLLYIVHYLPISFALTWCYEYSGSLWTVIFFHASNNYLAMSLLQAM